MKSHINNKLSYNSLDELLAQFKDEKVNDILLFFRVPGKRVFAFAAASSLISLIIIFIS